MTAQERFQPCPLVTAAVERVIEMTFDYQRGDTLTWHAILHWTGFDRRDAKWPAFRERLHKRFRKERGIELFHYSDEDQGWRLSTIAQTCSVIPEKRMKRAMKQAHKTIRALRAIPDAEVNDRQRIRINEEVLSAQEVQRIAKKKRQEVLRRSDAGTIPRRPKTI